MSKREKQSTDPAAVSRHATKKQAPKATLAGKKPVFIFVGGFLLLLGLFYALTFIPFMDRKALPALQVFNAKASAVILNVFQEGATANDTTIMSPRDSVSIAHGCDAIEPIGLFLAAVLAFPTTLRSKIPGLFIGTALLMVMNLIRIVSLFYTRVYWPSAFETMHIDVWQPAFIVFSLFFWVVWALWATRPVAAPALAMNNPASA